MTQIAVVSDQNSNVPKVFWFNDSASETSIIDHILGSTDARMVCRIEICTVHAIHMNEPSLSIWLRNTKRLTK